MNVTNAIDQEAPGDGDTAIPDAADKPDIEESSTSVRSDAEAAAAPVSGLSKLYKIHENMNATGLAASSAAAVPSALSATNDQPAAINASEQEASVDMDMPDAAGASQIEKIEEISTGGNFALFMAQVCLSFFFYSRTSSFSKED